MESYDHARHHEHMLIAQKATCKPHGAMAAWHLDPWKCDLREPGRVSSGLLIATSPFLGHALTTCHATSSPAHFSFRPPAAIHGNQRRTRCGALEACYYALTLCLGPIKVRPHLDRRISLLVGLLDGVPRLNLCGRQWPWRHPGWKARGGCSCSPWEIPSLGDMQTHGAPGLDLTTHKAFSHPSLRELVAKSAPTGI